MGGTWEDIAVCECTRSSKPNSFEEFRTSPTPEASPDADVSRMRPIQEAWPDAGDSMVTESSRATIGITFKGTENYDWSPAQIKAAQEEQTKWQLAATERSYNEMVKRSKEHTGPEPGATYEDIRIYSGNKRLGWKYWGVKPPDVDIDDYWVIRDPDRTRNLDETYRKKVASAPTPEGTSPVAVSLPVAKRKPGRPRKSPRANQDNRAEKPGSQSAKFKGGIRRTPISEISSEYLEVVEQLTELPASPHRSGK